MKHKKRRAMAPASDARPPEAPESPEAPEPPEASEMQVTIKTILHFKAIFGAETRLALPASSTLQDLLQAMAARWGRPFRDQILQPGSERPRSHVRLLINGRDIAFLNDLQTVLQPDDDVLIMPPIAGG